MAIKENHLPQTGYVWIPVILAIYPVGRSTWWAGEYSPAIKLSPNITAWKAEDIHALIKSAGE